LLALTALQFIAAVDFMLVMPLGPHLLAALNLGARDFGWLVAAYTLAAGLAGLLVSPWLDRWPRKPTYLAVSLGLVAGAVASGLARDYLVLLGARCLTGACAGIHGGLTLAMVADVFPPAWRGRATGRLMLAFACASVAGVPLSLALANHSGWRAPFLGLAVLGLPLVVLAARILPAPAQPPLARLRGTLTFPAHRRALGLTALLMAGAFAVIPFIGTALVANAGVSVARLPLVFIAGGLLTLGVAPLTGKLVDRHGAGRVFPVAALLSALLLLAVTHLPAVGFAVAAPVAAAVMAANAGRMVSALSLITASVEPARRAGFLAANAAVQHLASGAGTLLAGLVLQGGAGEPLRSFGTVGLVAAGATLASLAVGARIRPVG
jgi:DHA1 family inner membrane transport protein